MRGKILWQFIRMKDTRLYSPCLPLVQADGLEWDFARAPRRKSGCKNDFIFSAICEELGGIFAICLIFVCMSFFLTIVEIALQIKNPFYKLIAIGLGAEYAFQVFSDHWRCYQIHTYDRCDSSSGQLWRKFHYVYDFDDRYYPGLVYL